MWGNKKKQSIVLQLIGLCKCEPARIIPLCSIVFTTFRIEQGSHQAWLNKKDPAFVEPYFFVSPSGLSAKKAVLSLFSQKSIRSNRFEYRETKKAFLVESFL